MARSSFLLVLVLHMAAMIASAPAWAHANDRRGHAAPAAPHSPRMAPAAMHHYTPSAPHVSHVAPQYRPAYFPPRPVIRPAYTAYAPLPRMATVSRVVVVPSPYYVAVSSYYNPGAAGYSAASSGWGWTPVDSVVGLAGQQQVQQDVRFYCPDYRAYYPEVQTCPSEWLKVIP